MNYTYYVSNFDRDTHEIVNMQKFKSSSIAKAEYDRLVAEGYRVTMTEETRTHARLLYKSF